MEPGGHGIERMFKATLVLFIMVASWVILYAAFGDPIHYLCTLFLTIDGTVTAQIEDSMNFIDFLFGATVVFGVIAAFIIYAVYAHKKEYEQ